MKKLLESLELLNTINEKTEKAEIMKIASKAFSNCPLCLEAAAIMSKLMDDENERENFLIEAIDNALKEIQNKNIDDGDVLSSLLRGYFELGCFYFEYGKYLKAAHYYELLRTLDRNDMFKVSYRLISLYAYFEDKKIEALYKELISDDAYNGLKIDVPYLVYKYKQSEYEKVKELIKKIDKENKQFIKILNNEVNQEDEECKNALTVLRNNSFLINSCPYLIDYLRSHYD